MGAAGTAKSCVCVQRVTCIIPNVAQFGWRVSDLTLDENKYNVSAAYKQILWEEESESFNCCAVIGDGDNDNDADD